MRFTVVEASCWVVKRLRPLPTLRPLRLLTTGTRSSPVSVLMSILLGFRQRCRFCLGLEN